MVERVFGGPCPPYPAVLARNFLTIMLTSATSTMTYFQKVTGRRTYGFIKWSKAYDGDDRRGRRTFRDGQARPH